MATAPVGFSSGFSPTVGFAPSHCACRRSPVPSSNTVSVELPSFIHRLPQGTAGWLLHPWGILTLYFVCGYAKLVRCPLYTFTQVRAPLQGTALDSP